MCGRVWQITLKDLILLTRDRRALLLLLLLPLMFISVLGLSAGKVLAPEDDHRRFVVGVLCHEDNDLTSAILRRLRSRVELEVLTFRHREQLAQEKGGQLISATIILPPDLADRVEELTVGDFLREGQAEADVLLGIELNLQESLLDAELLRFFLITEIRRAIFPSVARRHALLRRYFPEEDTFSEQPVTFAEADRDAIGRERISRTQSEASRDAGASASDRAYRFLVPGFTVMFTFFLVNLMARSFHAEREQGTLRRLQLSPLTSFEILVGKTIPYFLTSVVQIVLLFGCGKALFGMSWGAQPQYLIPLVLATSASATAVGLLLSTLVRSDQQVSTYGTALVLLLGGLGGCFMPRAWMTPTMRLLSLMTPHAWALLGFQEVLSGHTVDPHVVTECCAMLLLFAGGCMLLGWWRFRRMVWAVGV